MEKVSVVILNYNGEKHLQTFLPDVVRYSSPYSVIVADNASSDNSVAFIKENFSTVRVIQLEENGGFAKGYNEALKEIESEYFLLLNSDVEVSENWIKPLVKCLENDPLIAGVQPKVRSYSNRQLFEHAGAAGGFLDTNYFPFCRGRIFEKTEEDNGQYDNAMEVFWASGVALLIRSSVFKEVGGFDERFFAHMEEIDLCWRAKIKGYRFMIEPKSVIYHVGGGTLEYMSPFKTFLNFRNSLYMIVKNHKGLLFPKLFWRLCLDGIAGVNFLFKGQFKNIWMIIKSHFTLYANLSSLLKDRKSIQADLTKSNLTGLYRGNIIWAFFVKGIKYFDRLNQRLFEKY